MDFVNTYIGEFLALLCAIVWAFSVILFKKSGEGVHPIGLNLFKNVLAAVLLVPTIWATGGLILHPVPLQDYLLLLLSGVLGIGIADTLFFKCLNTLGAGLTAIVDCMYSPFIIGLSMLWLGETLSMLQLFGAIMIISAVLLIMVERHHNTINNRMLFLGILWGTLALAAMAVSVVMIKPLLEQSPLLWTTEIRLIGGIAVLLVIMIFHPSRRTILASIHSSQRWLYTISGSFIGAYVSMILWLAGMKYTQASTAAALNQTSNVFVFIFAALLLRERITLLRLIAICLAVTGAVIVTFG